MTWQLIAIIKAGEDPAASISAAVDEELKSPTDEESGQIKAASAAAAAIVGAALPATEGAEVVAHLSGSTGTVSMTIQTRNA